MTGIWLLTVSLVLPSMNFGKSLDPVKQGHPSTSFMVQAVFEGNVDIVANSPQCKHAQARGNDYQLIKMLDFFVDVQDNARLHVAALIHPGVLNERIFAYAQPYTWRGVQRAVQALYPNKSFSGNIEDIELDASQIDRAPRAETLLKDMGRPGWTSLEESVRMNVEDLA